MVGGFLDGRNHAGVRAHARSRLMVVLVELRKQPQSFSVHAASMLIALGRHAVKPT